MMLCVLFGLGGSAILVFRLCDKLMEDPNP